MKFAVLNESNKDVVTEMIRNTANLAVIYGRLTPTQREQYDKALECLTVPTKTATQIANLGGSTETKPEPADGILEAWKSEKPRPARNWLNSRVE